VSRGRTYAYIAVYGRRGEPLARRALGMTSVVRPRSTLGQRLAGERPRRPARFKPKDDVKESRLLP
jgi:hypothetical protein